MGFNEETNALNSLKVQAVGALLGLQLPLRGSVRCPFPDHDDHTPSFEVRPTGTYWVCYGCNRRGGAIDLVKVYRGTDFVGAKKWLREAIGWPVGDARTSRTVRVAPAVLRLPLPSVTPLESAPDHEVYEALFALAPLQSDGLEYLVRRGLSTQTISAFQVGQIKNPRATIETLIESFSYDRVEAAGLLTKASTLNNWHSLFPGEAVAFPFFEGHRITSVQVRMISERVGRGKWRNLNHRRRRIYNIDALIDPRSTSVGICEGVIDTLSAIELGYGAIGLMGVNAELGADVIESLRGKSVDILMDWDPPGEKRAAELHKQMRRFGITPTRKNRPSPSAVDINDYLIERRRG